MKKTVLSILALSMSVVGFSQFTETFDDQAAFDAWTQIDNNGDTYMWSFVSAGAPNDGGVAYSESWRQGVGAIAPDNFLISPAIDLTNMSGAIALDWDAYAQDQDWPSEKYSVIIASGNDINAMNAGDVVFTETLQAYGAPITRTVDLTSYGGQTIYIAFRHHDCNDMFRLHIDNIEVYENNVVDAFIAEVKSPNNDVNCLLSNTEDVVVTIFNASGNPITNFDVSYTINGGTPVVETVTQSIPSASSLDYTFTTQADLSVMGEYNISATVSLSGDENAGNDTKAIDIRSSDANIEIIAETDASGGQNWELVDNATGTVVASHGGYQWDITESTTVCVYSSACYTLNYTGAMTGNITVNYNGTQVFATNGTVPASITLPALGGGCPDYEYALDAITTPQIVGLGMEDISFMFTNNGAQTITEVNFDYSIDGGADVNTVLTGLSIASGQSVELTASTQADFSLVGSYNLAVEINNVNGGEVNAETADDSKSLTITVVENLPKKVIVFEEGTGTWCGWCPRGTVALWNLEKDYPETAIGIAVHNGDPMVVTEYDNGIGTFIDGYPGGVVDRVDVMDPGAFANGYNNRINMVPPVDVNATYKVLNGNELEITVEGTFISDMSGDFRFNAVVLEDGVTGTGASWAQANYYSGGGQGNLSGAGLDWHNEADPVPASKMVYDHVARAILGGFTGAANSIPSTITAGTKYTHTFNYTVPGGYDMNEISVAGIVHGPNNGEIVNAGKAKKVSSVTEMPNVILDFDVSPNPANEVINMRIALSVGAKVNMQLTDITGKVILSESKSLNTGSFIKQLNVASVPNGLYLLVLDVDGNTTTEKVVISHN